MSVKNEEETYGKIIEMIKNNDHTTGNLLDLAYFKENYRLIAIDLSKQSNLKDPRKTWRKKQWSNNVFYNWKVIRNYFWAFTKFCQYLIKEETQKL